MAKLGAPLDEILRSVSRSVYLSLRVLPRGLAAPIGLAYLFCRAADTIADTQLLAPAVRLAALERYRVPFREDSPRGREAAHECVARSQGDSAERALLERLCECFALLDGLPTGDQERIRRLVLTLTEGMRMDLTIFPAETDGRVVALETRADLDRYTYHVAGCVGEFWTRMLLAHRAALAGWDTAAMERDAVCFGKGLQLTNILRDLPRDLRLGRCYLPGEDLRRLGLRPEDLLDPGCLARLRPLIDRFVALALEYYRRGWAYTLAVPRRESRLRLACIWPLWIGLRTLAVIRCSPHLLDPARRLRIPRREVYGLVVRSAALVWSNGALDMHWRRLASGLSAPP